MRGSRKIVQGGGGEVCGILEGILICKFKKFKFFNRGRGGGSELHQPFSRPAHMHIYSDSCDSGSVVSSTCILNFEESDIPAEVELN